MSNIKINVRGTFRAVLLLVWMDLDTLFAILLQEIARVLGSQSASAESDIDPV